MGFFSSLRNIVQSKPIDETAAPEANNSYQTDGGKKIIPVIVIERSECHQKGEHMVVYADIKNESTFPLTLDRMRFLGSDKGASSDLSPGESTQYKVYEGPRPKDTRNVNFEITYRNLARDYFSALYYAQFKQEADGTYSVTQFKPQRQVKDI